MPTTKTAVSIDTATYEKADELAQLKGISRSRLYTEALEQYVKRHRNQELLERINASYEDELDEEEEAILRTMARHMRDQLKNEE